MTVQLLPCTDGDAWCAALPDDADVYLDPGYVRAAALGDLAWLAIAEAHGARIALPFVEHSLPEWLDMAGWRDAESPYGYPGLVADGDPIGWPACWRAIVEELAQRRVVNVFVRLNPLAPCPAAMPYLLPFEQPTAWIPLGEGTERAFEGSACRTHRSQASRARALGFFSEVVESPNLEDMDKFRARYNETMEYVGADHWYRFPQQYYEHLARALGPRLVLIRTRAANGEVHSEALLLRGPRWGHYHLSARRSNAHNVSGHSVLQAAAEWGVTRGLTGIHLGGGATARSDDSLFQFKSRVGKARAVFHCAGLVVASERHEMLTARWKAATGQEPRRFQSYRHGPVKAGAA